MATYSLQVGYISRKKGGSLARRISYCCGKRIRDNRVGQTYYKNRKDVLFHKVFLPDHAPAEYADLQILCDHMDEAEKRCDARTARTFIGALPNELTLHELVKIVEDFIREHFTEHGLCAIAAIHAGINPDDCDRNNPHVHILVSTRTLDSDGFSQKKAREQDRKEYVPVWRESWARLQNQAYERNGMDLRVSHESLKAQGVLDREPHPRVHHIEWQVRRKRELLRQRLQHEPHITLKLVPHLTRTRR